MLRNWDADTPIYLQLYQQVIQRILDGHIGEGDALPSVRNVAAEYQLNPVTISKAYQMLQDEEIVEKQRGKGLFVKDGVADVILARERQQFLQKEWPVILQQIIRLKLSASDLLAEQREDN
ncbi:GntR family transcriptional regulator [Alteromonas sediminis]|uniref:GntR family transcriptional regulator n=1 Tax=Alteromonas sediminis TaxID=2259342 RepID=A0A3N5Z9J4_9ALTE|nr:GntR family transcriptional regulator [Alteromonas sediminis]RPJ65948.1 GntR family transcriptional regulator [Alteromonas sediminis]